ncbi:hypothetical protein EG68_07028 [Paragonimus skrjabini miyazakii]|uniref:Uncharacterized protein n=1 Tax=Paragonimus skrjabini miyazakii TaxID=59628 RepID=A0A8S9YSD1_9TREM|nr:hypothetical protein EG68_07028 [Paragonimus skrjabini miyazakii]
MSHFVGCWRFIRAENLDELLKTLKVNEGLRKLATVARPRVIIRMVSVKELEVASITDCVTVVEQAIFDEEFTEITADGRVVTSTFTKESESKMRKVQKHADLNTVVQYEVQGDELTTTVTAGCVTAKAKFSRHNNRRSSQDTRIEDL